jgi:Zn-dependent protease with chaperone function
VSGLAGTLALAALAGALFAAATSFALALSGSSLRRRLARLHPAARARAAFAAAVAPSLAPALLVALCFAPGLIAAAGLHGDHCLRHPGHAHLCLAHPGAALPAGAAFAAAAAVAACAASLLAEARRHRRASRWLGGLGRSPSALGADVSLVASGAPLSFAAGLLRPRVHLAEGLVSSLAPEQLAAVLAHERAHARRRDPLARALARTLSWPHLPRMRRALLGEHALAAEQACDAEAAREVGDRLAVAEAILAVERLFAPGAGAPPAGQPAFAGDAVAARVEALLAAEPPQRGAPAARLAIPLALAALLARADPLHHATEHALGLLLAALP